MHSRWDGITVKLQNAVAICLSDCAITALMHGMHAEWPDITCHPGWVATHPTQGTCPVLQHCSGITTVVPFTFTCNPVIDPIQRYDRWAAHWSSRLIANQNQPRETDMRVPEIQKGVSETDWAASRSALSRRVWGLPNPFLKRPPGQLWRHQDGGGPVRFGQGLGPGAGGSFNHQSMGRMPSRHPTHQPC